MQPLKHRRPLLSIAAALGTPFLLGVASDLITRGLPPWPWFPAAGLLAAGGIQGISAYREWRRSHEGPPEHAVLRVGAGPDDVGSAVRIAGGRWLVCPARVVHQALGGTGEWHARPERSDRITVRVPRSDGTERRVLARVVLWGPSLRRGDRCDLAVLRTVRRLPLTGGRTLRGVASPDGPVEIILPAVAAATRASPVRGRKQGDVIVLPADVTVPAGAVVARRGGGPDGEFIGLLDPADGGPARTPSTPTPFAPTPSGVTASPATPGEQTIRVVDAASAEALRRSALSRRGVLLGGVAAVTAAAGVAVAVAWPSVTRRPLRGAGWEELFLTDEGEPQAWLGGGPAIGAFRRISGRDSLRLTKAELEELDFVTCPNEFIAGELNARAGALLGRAPFPVHNICTDSMVVLARQEFVRAMQQGGLLVRPAGRDDVYLDLTRYLKRCHLEWRRLDPGLAIEPGRLVTIDTADPRSAGGGQNFLAALAQTQAQMIRSDQAESGFTSVESLWRRDAHRPGPLRRSMAASSSALLADLVSGRRHVIYTYEHDALETMSRRRHDLMLLRTRPEVTFTQQLLVLTEAGEAVRRQLTSPKASAHLGDLGMRVPGQEDRVAARLDQLHRDTARRVGTVDTVDWQPRPVDLDTQSIEHLLTIYEASA